MNATLTPQRRIKARMMTGFPAATTGQRRREDRRTVPSLATHDFLVPNARPDLSTDPLMLAMLERP